jgi:hypothetical protein
VLIVAGSRGYRIDVAVNTASPSRILATGSTALPAGYVSGRRSSAQQAGIATIGFYVEVAVIALQASERKSRRA